MDSCGPEARAKGIRGQLGTWLSNVFLPHSASANTKAVIYSALIPETGLRNRHNVVPYTVEHIFPKKTIRKYIRMYCSNWSQKNHRDLERKGPWNPIQRTILDERPLRYGYAVAARPPIAF